MTWANRCATLILGALLLLGLSACGEQTKDEKPTTPPQPSPSQTATTQTADDQPQSDTQQPSGKISAVPTMRLTVPAQSTPLPFKQGGLRFQMKDAPAGKQMFKPLGDVAWLEDGALLMSFPEQHAMIRFSPVAFDLTMIGGEQVGGKNETVVSPNLLWVHQGVIQSVSRSKHQALSYNHDFQVVNAYNAAGVSPVPYPGGQYLLRADDRPDVFFRVDQSNRPLQTYRVPVMPNEHIEGRKLVFFPINADHLYAAKQNATSVYLFNADSTLAQIWDIDMSPFFGNQNWGFGAGAQLMDLHIEATQMWLLLDHREKRNDNKAYLLSMHTLTGEFTGFWEIGFDADRMDVNRDFIVLAQRENARAMTFQR